VLNVLHVVYLCVSRLNTKPFLKYCDPVKTKQRNYAQNGRKESMENLSETPLRNHPQQPRAAPPCPPTPPPSRPQRRRQNHPHSSTCLCSLSLPLSKFSASNTHFTFVPSCSQVYYPTGTKAPISPDTLTSRSK